MVHMDQQTCSLLFITENWKFFIILKKGVAIFHRRNTPDYMFLRRTKLWELSHFKT